MGVETNALFYGDNLVWLRDHKYFPDESVDLIYLDPPFNSKADYNLIFNEPGKADKSQAQIKAFDDTWHWDSAASAVALNELAQKKPQIAEFVSWLSREGKPQESMAAYLAMMATRLIELNRVLRPDGSIYLHCDPTASHYLKVLMDAIFDERNLRNEIVWCYTSGGKSKRTFAQKHHTILFYTKTDDYIFNADDIRVPYSEKTLANYRPGLVGSTYTAEVKLHKKGKIPEDWWIIAIASKSTREYLHYPTQKPVALLEKIIKASCKRDGVVLDPFCGCGTTITAAQRLSRHWLGIDVTWLAIDLVEKRLRDTYGSNIVGGYEVHGKPYDVASARALARKDKKEFEIWAISMVGAAPREHDGGVDGIFGFVEQDKRLRTIIVQVKGGETLNPGMVRDLIGTDNKEGAAIGLLVTLNEPTRGMMNLAVHSERYKSDLWDKDFPSIQIRTVGDLLEGKDFELPPTQSPLKNAQLAREKGEQIRQAI
jgi:site-specific DNA-methyltransferase (adenine-specific)